MCTIYNIYICTYIYTHKHIGGDAGVDEVDGQDEGVETEGDSKEIVEDRSEKDGGDVHKGGGGKLDGRANGEGGGGRAGRGRQGKEGRELKHLRRERKCGVPVELRASRQERVENEQDLDWALSICSVLQCVTVCCSVLQCVSVCCSALQCVAGKGRE